jgi:2-phospho-L-lactate guanylyltransferase
MRALLVPVKSFATAKHRLAPVLDEHGRRVLAQRLARIVLHATPDLETYVACDDGEVADWAVSEGAFVLWTPGLGLSGAVRAGVEHLGSVGYELVVVAHADLPLVSSLAAFGREGEVTLAPDLRLDGTNVAAVPASADFAFAYGAGSFARHRAEGERLGLTVHVVHDRRLASDVDLPADLALVSDLVADLVGPSVVSPAS